MLKKEPAKLNIPHRDKKPDFYCVKTTYHNNGKIESEIMAEEKSNVPIAIELDAKPLDGVFETATATIYYTYHEGYEEAAQQVAVMMRQNEQTMQMVCFANILCRFFFAENRTDNDYRDLFREHKCRLKSIPLQFFRLLSMVNFALPWKRVLPQLLEELLIQISFLLLICQKFFDGTAIKFCENGQFFYTRLRRSVFPFTYG